MNKFYVEEGNKRVSVMKYFQAVSIPGYVTRLIPKRTDEKENKIVLTGMDNQGCIQRPVSSEVGGTLEDSISSVNSLCTHILLLFQ